MWRAAVVSFLIVLCLPYPVGAQGDPAPPPGTEVQVQLTNGTRFKGRLVSLGSSEVVIRRWTNGPETSTKLSEVLRVDTVHHNRRNLALVGLAAGIAAGLLIDWCGSGSAYGLSGEPPCLTPRPALVVAGGALAGALAGHAMDRRQQRTLFLAPARSGPSRGGPAVVVGAIVRW